MATGTTKFGTLNEFNSDVETIAKYLDQVLLYFEANEVADDKRVPILLSSIGPTTYSVICDLAAPVNPKTLTMPAIAQLLKDHFEPKRLIIAERFTFHRRNQRPGETMAEYDASLRKLAVTCEFEAYLEEVLRDRFVCGLCSEAIQRRLLSEPKLTLVKDMELAQGMEAADHSSRRLKGQEQHIKKVIGTSIKPQSSPQSCYRCGKSNHTPAECRFKDSICNACGKKGHIVPACRSNPPKKHNFPGNSQKLKEKTYRTHQVHQASQGDADSDEDYTLSEPMSTYFSPNSSHATGCPKTSCHGSRHRSYSIYNLGSYKKEILP